MSATELIAKHILEHRSKSTKPLFVALQGPQGSGKSYLAAHLHEYLIAEPYSLRVAVLSIDDLYLTHEGLVSLAADNSTNLLWQGRGQPGTHDINLGMHILSALKEGKSDVEIPHFDKSLYNGAGDRLPMDGSGRVIKQPPPVDVVILEGWCVGFYPISAEELQHRWDGMWKRERERLGLNEEQVARKIDLQDVNAKLKEYVRIWEFFDVLIKPLHKPASKKVESEYDIVYEWRLEQEHNMKAKNGGRGMSDDAVKSFVDRYIPGYVFFGDEIPSGPDYQHPKWTGKGLTLLVNERRAVVGTSTF
ncbi:P-loop containing nucleoside triphosphate hydrolase protein [Crucibulum laeve]|uniref:P-loop containing nucleoside triphosphate hydrolase protein n=1 Tax=Crucibulum laeve TaxID=68775 RepID=A0A5C3MU24_9AGAR|nr:P-loop containing nucleoside triphosphate hydrolase protein [Crucibulum laeve]